MDSSIYTLSNHSEHMPLAVGEEINHLAILARNGTTVAPSIVATTEVFLAFSKQGVISDESIESIINLVRDIGFKDSEKIFIRCSTTTKCIGLYTRVACNFDYANIKYHLEKTYRSWYKERARSFRVVHHIEDSKTFPAILIQPYNRSLKTLVTRHAVTGLPTDAVNYNDHIANNVDRFENRHGYLLKRVESALCRPVEVHFDDCEECVVYGISEQAITTQAYLKAISDHYNQGSLSKTGLLRLVHANMLAKYQGYVVAGEGIHSDMVLSPGRSKGKLVFRTSDIPPSREESYILAILHASPEDVDLISNASGAITSVGGMTSHLAVICRGFGIPAALLSEVVIDERQRNLRMSTGEIIKENHPITLDGPGGKVYLSDDHHLEPSFETIDEAKDQIALVIGLLEEFNTEETLNVLPLDVQLHISKLNYRARQIGLLR